MSSNDSPRTSIGPSLFPLNIGSRRGSLASLTGTASVDKEHLSQALDRIHSTACQSDTLTTFNEFAPPPQSSATEQQGIAGDIMQHGLSGLYSRFKGAVGGGKDKHGILSNNVGDGESIETGSVNSIRSPTPISDESMIITRKDSGDVISPGQQSTSSSSRLQSATSSSFPSHHLESQPQTIRSPKTSASSTATTPKMSTSTRPTITPMSKSTASSAIVPTVAPISVSAFKDSDKIRIANNDTKQEDKVAKRGEPVSSINNTKLQVASLRGSAPRSNSEGQGASEKNEVIANSTASTQSKRRLPSTTDGSLDSGKILNANQSASSSLSLLQVSSRGPVRPAAVERIAHSQPPSFRSSRASSTDRSTAEASPITTSAHLNIRHETFSPDESQPNNAPGLSRIPGTTINEGAPEAVNARLEQMRKQVLSKEFWMADEICKECFLCNDSFSAFRRKHHCRTCGCIFDSKCTSTISGQRFGVQGTLRICKTCLAIINSRYDSSEESDDGSSLPGFFNPRKPKHDSSKIDDPDDASLQHQEQPPEDGKPRPVATPMMAIAARRVGDSANRHSLVLDDGPQISRPGSSRSLKTLSAGGRPASSAHKRHQSRNNFLGRFKPTAEETAPFHHGRKDDSGKRSRLPAFHDDNIIDPDLAPYMSDEESSADEQPSIFATMNSGSIANPNFENDRSGLGSLLSASKKHRMRGGEKSVSGVSFTSRGMDETSGTASVMGFTRPSRRRNLSTANTSMLLSRSSPRQIPFGFGNLDEELAKSELSLPTNLLSSRMTRSASMRDARAPVIELNSASLQHVHRLLRQLLEDTKIPNVASWEKALMPILLQCTDDVNPNVRHGDDIDIRHFVKTKKIPGGKPGDTSYVSGVVFSKNLALKSMLRTIANPRIVIVSFPIEYQRHHHHFMSLEPVMAEEKEFLKNMVNRIASLRPQLLLVQKNISGLALQYLVEANIAVAYNVKQSVIAAVSRFAQTEIISSIDMVALKPVHIGKCAGFDVKTYVHKDIPGKKKTYIYLSGCPKELGCTIVLRGANTAILSRVKQITDFMVYVVYNLKLETCLMRDEWVALPSITGSSGSISPSKPLSHSTEFSLNPPTNPVNTITAASDKLQAMTDQAMNMQEPIETGIQTKPASVPIDEQPEDPQDKVPDPEKTPKVVSAHQSHTHGSHDDQLPDDIPMPTLYSDMVSKHQTKILSASPFVKFNQPYLLMRAREQERRLLYLKKLRDRDILEEDGKSKPQKFQLIKPEMVHGTVKNASRQVMEVLHAVHDAEYDKAMHNYQTQKRQWENQVQINNHLFDPYARQNITVLYTVVCTETKIPCSGPDLLALDFYNEREESNTFQPDCTLGQYVEDLCLSANTICMSNGCERKMSEHHRTYVHGEARITIIVERSASKIPGYQDEILMWSYCKICEKETQPMPMSDSSWKYSLGKYLELSFWSRGLGLNATFCPHDLHRDHLRYFGYKNVAISIHYDPIDLLEIVVPRARITWKVDNDLKLKNDLFTKIEERWNRFMASVKSRIKDINIDSVVPEKTEACKVEVERLTNLAQEEHSSLTRKLQQKYMESKYYEIIPMNRAVRAMQEKVAKWDDAFANFETNFFPSERDIRRLATLQLKKMFMDRDESTTSVVVGESTDLASDADEKSPSASFELARSPANISPDEARDALSSVMEENLTPAHALNNDQPPIPTSPSEANDSRITPISPEGMEHLDLALPHEDNSEVPTPSDVPVSPELSGTPTPLADPSSSFFGDQSESTLSERVELLRRAETTLSIANGIQPEPSGLPRPSERGGLRRAGLATSPPMNRTQSQPAGTLRRIKPSTSKSHVRQDRTTRDISDNFTVPVEPLKPSATEPVKPTDKKLSERLGLSTLRSKKPGHSLIPRSVTSRRKETKVSTLAKHFEQLSREFEKERVRDRRQRAAKVTQSRAFPKASSKPIVEIYKDVNDAVEERGPGEFQPSQPDGNPATVVDGLASLNTAGDGEKHATPKLPTDTAATAEEAAEETATEAETDDNQHNVSQTGSDDDGAASDADHSLLDQIIPGAAEIAESLGKPNADLPLELPKHEKSSLMKMLTNFWAERSASGWTALEYPVSTSDHIFADMDVIIREDEPSSLIAFALQSPRYQDELAGLRAQETRSRILDAGVDINRHPRNEHDVFQDGNIEPGVETSLLREQGTHISLSFTDGSATLQCKIFYAEQFDALRRKCGVADRIVESLSRCLKWDSKGGKTKSVFLKTLDDRLILKSLSSIETQAFLNFAPAYFNMMAEILFHELPSVIAKMLGFYQIVLKNPVTGIEVKLDVLVMENLFYDRTPDRIFDLKGSMRNRKIESTGEQNEVLLDENMVEFIYESPLFTREVRHSQTGSFPVSDSF